MKDMLYPTQFYLYPFNYLPVLSCANIITRVSKFESLKQWLLKNSSTGPKDIICNSIFTPKENKKLR